MSKQESQGRGQSSRLASLLKLLSCMIFGCIGGILGAFPGGAYGLQTSVMALSPANIRESISFGVFYGMFIGAAIWYFLGKTPLIVKLIVACVVAGVFTGFVVFVLVSMNAAV